MEPLALSTHLSCPKLPLLALGSESTEPSVGIFVLWVPILELFPRCLEHLRLCDCSGQHHRHPGHRVWGKSPARFSLVICVGVVGGSRKGVQKQQFLAGTVGYDQCLARSTVGGLQMCSLRQGVTVKSFSG